MNVKGSYYENGALEPIDVIDAWGLGFSEGSIVKYLARWRHKDGHPECCCDVCRMMSCHQHDMFKTVLTCGATMSAGSASPHTACKTCGPSAACVTCSANFLRGLRDALRTRSLAPRPGDE